MVYRMLQVSQRFILTALNQKCRFGNHGFAGYVLRSCPALKTSFFVLMHIPAVVGSGSLRKEATASPNVTRVGALNLRKTITITTTLVVFAAITINMITRLNSILHCSGTTSTKQYAYRFEPYPQVSALFSAVCNVQGADGALETYGFGLKSPQIQEYGI